MLILGVICLVLGFILHIQILWIIGVILAVVGLILLLLNTAGHTVGGRNWY